MITVDHVLGSAAYGVVVITLALIANIGQSMHLSALPTCPASRRFVSVAVLNQAVWVTWGLLVHDAGTIMTASTVCGSRAFNLVWYLLRRSGLRAFYPAPDTGTRSARRHPRSGSGRLILTTLWMPHRKPGRQSVRWHKHECLSPLHIRCRTKLR